MKNTIGNCNVPQMLKEVAGMESMTCPPLVRLFILANDMSSAELKAEAERQGMPPVPSFATLANQNGSLQDALEVAAEDTDEGVRLEQEVRQRILQANQAAQN